MTRRDVHLDAMLRHLGAAYYESVHGQATVADVARALDSVEDRTGIGTRRGLRPPFAIPTGAKPAAT
jgi:hypothetical protein